MTSVDDMDGGAAYPSVGYRGMSLRDWFAGMALQGIVPNDGTGADRDYLQEKSHDFARVAYNLADAMLKTREI